jgi:hypothetical protein
MRGRGASPGYWRLKKTCKIMDEEARKIGEVRKKLRYRCKYGVPTDWLMAEYHLCGCQTARPSSETEPVFCMFYVSRRGL